MTARGEAGNDMVIFNSPSGDLAKSPSQRSVSNPAYLKVLTGTPDAEHEKAHRTFLNELGPGQYTLPPLTGRQSLESKRRNIPNISFGGKTKAPWNAEYHTDFVGKSSPPSTRYSPQIGKTSNEQSTNQLGRMGSEKKFREPTSVTKLRESLPVQYGGQYDIDSVNNGFTSVLKRVNGRTMEQTETLHADMKRNYRQVSMGYGKRSDFTKLPQSMHDPGFVYDQDKITSIKSRVSQQRQVKEALNTFGSSYKTYDKSIVHEGQQHWYGRGPSCNLGNDGTDMRLLKKKVQTFASANRDRGLLVRGSFKAQKSSAQPGPGSYNTIDHGSMQGQIAQQMSRRSPLKVSTNMSRATREVSFTKYSGANSRIYANGLL